MKKNLVLMFLSIFTIFLFYGTSQALFLNGTFDSNADGWTWEHIDSAGGWRSLGGNPGGNFILNDGGSSSTDPTISQLVSGLTASSWYTLTGDFASEYSGFGSASALSFGIFADGVVIDTLIRPGAEGVWGSFSYNIFANDTDILFAFKGEMNGDDSSYRIDNISLTLYEGPSNTVPEPATMFLLGTGLVGLAGLRRKFKK